MLLKGAALALGAYPRPADRWFLDLDVLVPRDRVAPVCAALEAVGYRSLQGARNPLYYEKHHLHRILLGPQGSVVEVHWDLTLPHSVYRCDLDGVFARAEERPLGRLHAACAAPVDQIIHGVYQNIADGFVDLRRVMDMALLVRDHPDLDWGRLVGLAVNSGMDKALWISLHNMKLISGIGAPQSALNVLAPAGATRRTLLGLDTAAGCLRRRASRSEGYTPLLHLLLTPTPSRQFRELLRAAWVGEELLLDRGYDPARLPGFGRRTLIGLTRLRMLARAGMLASWAWVTG